MSQAQNIREFLRSRWNLRSGLILAFRLALFIAGGCLAYLLFIFGHTDITPMGRILLVAAVAATSALVAAMLQWIGLPAEEKKGGKSTAKK